ncbi:hypothetical protein GCM10007981_13510 [Thermocladium modestius]|uniref:Exosome protein n=1 Tax=Thermocladium modestius TaxID=62609 RepID=A0A830GUP2_9CREN|nr:RNA-binding domain-containing protein [Thermocladium modestius]GGP21488.1 hypothetical protein GCM10007981_13510 [Thermocladium modestius]
MRCRIDKIEAEAHVHATEDQGRVVRALMNALGPGFDYEATSAQGHYGNPITIVRAVVDRSNGCPDRVASRLISMLGELDRQLLVLTADDRMEGGRLYLRLNKQAAYLGSMRLDDGGDVVRLIIYFNPGIAWGRDAKSLIGELVGQ